MPLDEDLAAWLRLSLTPGLGGAGARRLLTAFGDPKRAVGASRTALARHVPDKVAAAIQQGGMHEAVWHVGAWLEDPTNHVVTLADAGYPGQLLQLADPPLLIYVKGRLELLSRPSLAVVGSRHATAQGAANAESFARTLSDSGLTIVSGLALGIDAAAHRGGLGGAASSIAVLGTGADIVYPARNRALAHELAARGALVSDFPLGTRPLPANFPQRNRLISGLALGCLVVEAAADSGSLITARLAADQGREVFALPGSIHSPLAKGCHALIKQGAKLVESASDILEELRLPAPAPAESAPHPAADARAQALLDALGHDPCDLDTLAARCGLAASEIAALITQLELDGRIAPLPGGLYQRLRR
ncbi:MAG: DNA-protecting protein DprA [Betaproteobacteria bacterium]|nr:DNA-protecting protein DprA [Betaproteobacteria bacterium]